MCHGITFLVCLIPAVDMSYVFLSVVVVGFDKISNRHSSGG